MMATLRGTGLGSFFGALPAGWPAVDGRGSALTLGGIRMGVPTSVPDRHPLQPEGACRVPAPAEAGGR